MGIYLTNAATVSAARRGSAVSAGMVGPGAVLTIMAAPRVAYGEAGEGRVPALTPALADLQALQAGELSGEAYRDRFVQRAAAAALAPGLLVRDDGRPVFDGDTLICACGREQAAAGWCHRVWSAPALLRAGWDEVVLDGRFHRRGEA